MKVQDIFEARHVGSGDPILNLIQDAVEKIRSRQEEEIYFSVGKTREDVIRLITPHLGEEEWEDTDFGEQPFWDVNGVKVVLSPSQNWHETEVVVYENH